MSSTSFEKFAELCQTAKSIDALSSVLTRELNKEGYENNILTSLTTGEVGQVAWADFPEGYVETYLEQHWHLVDPVLDRSINFNRPFYWNEVVEKVRRRSNQMVFLNECRDMGVHSGIVIPMFGPDGRRDVMSLSKRHNDEIDPNRFPVLRAICTQAWWRFVELHTGSLRNHVEDSTIVLTAHQRDVLLWIKAGKSNEQISEIMSIASRTVDYHVANILARLGATNRVTAVVISLQKGLIEL